MTEQNRTEIQLLIADTDAADHELLELLDNQEFAKLINTACVLIAKAARHVFEKDPRFATAYTMQQMMDYLDEILKNPASPGFVQVIMMLTIALLTDDVPEQV